MWPSVGCEERKWVRDPDDLAFIPKSRRRKILPTYEAALPPVISREAVNLPSEIMRRIAEVEVLVARFDQSQSIKEYDLPALLLRSESSSSSQIERLPALLVEQPVVSAGYVAERLGITDRSARSLIESACARGILSKVGNARRGAFYQAPELVEVLEEASSIQGFLPRA